MTSIETESSESLIKFKYGDSAMEFVRQTETKSEITSINVVDKWGDLRVLCMCPDDRAASIVIGALKTVFAVEDQELMAKVNSYYDGYEEMDHNTSDSSKESAETSSPTTETPEEEQVAS